MRVLHWMTARPWLATVIFLTAALIAAVLLLRHEFDQQRERDRAQDRQAAIQAVVNVTTSECRAGNNFRAEMSVAIPEIVGDAGEALILTAANRPGGTPPRQEDIDALRANGTLLSGETVAKLTKPRDCAAETAAARREAERTFQG